MTHENVNRPVSAGDESKKNVNNTADWIVGVIVGAASITATRMPLISPSSNKKKK